MTDTPALTNIPFDDLEVGRRHGPYDERVSADLCARLSGSIGERAAVTQTPPAVFPVLFLKALRRSMGGIPAGSVLAKQELEFHGELPVDSTASVSIWIGETYIRRDRPFVVFEFDIRDERGAQVLTGRKVIVWPTGPGER